MKALVGTAGWAIPAPARDRFGEGASGLELYATRFDCVEINSSFHRRHRADTWQRWAQSVPEHFQFSLKLPKAITHQRRLEQCDDLLAEFADDTLGLGSKRAVIHVQLPPKLAFDRTVAISFFTSLQAAVGAQIVCEPRHPSWFESEADALLGDHRIARVAADPAPVPGAERPGGSLHLGYWRLHGSPHIYRSSYEAERLVAYADEMRAFAAPCWCIFDNTASSAATDNALAMSTSGGDPGFWRPLVPEPVAQGASLPGARRHRCRSANPTQVARSPWTLPTLREAPSPNRSTIAPMSGSSSQAIIPIRPDLDSADTMKARRADRAKCHHADG